MSVFGPSRRGCLTLPFAVLMGVGRGRRQPVASFCGVRWLRFLHTSKPLNVSPIQALTPNPSLKPIATATMGPAISVNHLSVQGRLDCLVPTRTTIRMTSSASPVVDVSAFACSFPGLMARSMISARRLGPICCSAAQNSVTCDSKARMSVIAMPTSSLSGTGFFVPISAAAPVFTGTTVGGRRVG